MLEELKFTASAYAVGGRFLTRLVADFTEADWAVRSAAGTDPRWLVGHIATYRNRVVGLMGLPTPVAPWEAGFAKGTKPEDLPADLDMQPVLASFHAADAAIAGAWEALTAEDLGKPFGRTLPNGSDTVGGALAFFVWHEAYHLGQLGMMRRLAGKPSGV